MNTKTRSLAHPLAAILLPLALLALGGCKSAPVRNPDYAPVPVPQPSAQPVTKRTGSLFTAGRRNLILFEDTRASYVGDLLTINLVEKTNASKSASVDASRNSDVSITNPLLLGRPFKFGSNPTDNLESSLSGSSSTSGAGDTAQSNQLQGTITVTVAEVQPNGNLVVRGEKLVGINQGHEYVRIEGIVRPADIGPDNSVDSTRIANVLIDYGGEGPEADAAKVGWLARFFTSIIFPF
ncbi:MAG: flagellar basal body L-ring protein FlgH [Gammaproteobacteria bacterium]